jgi:SSS family solute:Na+ symporter
LAGLSLLDGLIIGGFGALLVGLGLSAKLKDNTALQFLAAGRSLTLPFFVATLVSTWYGGVLGMGESVSYYGVGTWLLMGVPYYFFALVYAWLYAERVREADQISIPERLAASFGQGPGVAGAVLVFLLGVPAAHVLMAGVLLQFVTSWPLWACVAVSALAGGVFILKGGLLADVRVSLLAFLMMYVGFVILVGWCLSIMPPGQAVASLPTPGHRAFDGGQGFAAVVSFFLLGAWTLIDPGFHQRAASAESPQVAKKGVFWSAVCWVAFDALTITAGVYALALGPKDLASPLLAYPALAQQVLPVGLKALFYCGLLGTITSALVGYGLVSGAALGREILARLLPGTSELALTRGGVAASLALAVVLALQIESVVALWYSWGGCIIGALLLPVSQSYGLLGRFGGGGGFRTAGMALAFGCSLSLMIWGLATGNPFLTMTVPQAVLGYTLPQGLGGSQFGLGTLLPSLAVSLAVAALGTWIGRHESRNRA